MARLRRTSEMEKAFLFRKIEQMRQRGWLEPSTSEFNNPPVLVPYPAAIKAFLDTHKENVFEEMWKEEHITRTK